MSVETFTLIVKTKCKKEELEFTKKILDWVKDNKNTIRNGGVNIFVQGVTEEQCENTDIQQLLNKKYGVTALPCLYVPAHLNRSKESYNGWINIKKFLQPVIEAGYMAARDEISAIAEPESDIDMYMRKDLNMEAFKRSGNEEEKTIGSTLTQMDIHKAASKFMQKKPGAKNNDEFNNGLETKAINGHVSSAKKQDNINHASSSPVPPANIDSDDKLLDNLFANRLGLDLPDFK
jgi:hypothetical protein